VRLEGPQTTTDEIIAYPQKPTSIINDTCAIIPIFTKTKIQKSVKKKNNNNNVDMNPGQ